MPYPSIEPFLVTWLGTTAVDARACSELPADLAAALPVVQFQRVGGADPTLTLDEATVSVDCYAADRPSAYTLAEQVRAALRKAGGYHTSAGTLTGIRTISAPSARPYDNTTLRRIGATYLITLHSPV